MFYCQWYLRLFIYSFIATLIGCVNYTGLHAANKPLTMAVNSTIAVSCAWWQQFHDPQLSQLIDIALKNSPDMQIVEARVALAQQFAASAWSGLWPSLQASGYVNRERYTNNGLVPPPYAGTVVNSGEAGLDFHDEFDFWGRNRHAFEAALNQTKAAEAQASAVRLLLASAIASTYFQWQSDMAQQQLAENKVKQHQQMLAIFKMRESKGINDESPVNENTIALSNAEIALENLQQASALAKHQLAALVGKSPDDLSILPTHFPPDMSAFALPAFLPANLLGRRPDITALRWQIDAASQSVLSAKAAFYPNINLNALLSFQSIGLGNLFKASSRDASITPALSLPIFDAGQLRAQLGARYAAYDLAVSQYNRAILKALQDTADQLSALDTASAQLDAQKRLLASAKQNAYFMQKKYQRGIVDYLTVLQAQDAVLQQQMVQTQLKMRYLQAVIGLTKALGGGYQEDNDGKHNAPGG